MHRYKLTFAFFFLLTLAGLAQQKPYKGGSGTFTKLVWQDEFSKNGLPDTSKWAYDKGYAYNNELQFYTTRAENARIEKGNLVITALNDSLQIEDKVHPITSARLNTKGKKDWTYGRVEVRAKLPSSLGTWPAIWMLGSNIDTANWPACGEIDILEHVGYMPDTVHFNVHTEQYNHVKKTGKGTKVPFNGVYNDFHVYAIEWFKDRIDWYMDDKKVFTYASDGAGTDSWPFYKPQFLILNLAFGGDWGGSKGVDLSKLPQQFLIDYVRVYQ